MITQEIFKYIEASDREVTVFELGKMFSDFSAEAIDQSLELLSLVGFLKQDNHFKWQLTDEAKKAGEDFEKGQAKRISQTFQRLEQLVELEIQKANSSNDRYNRRFMAFTFAFSLLLILVFI